MLTQPTVLIVDDDPSHLKLYAWIAERAGWRAQTVQVKSSSLDLKKGDLVDLILMDYRLSSSLTAADVVHELKGEFPEAPIVVLSQEYGMPSDMKSHAIAFVRKGQPEELVRLLNQFRDSGSALSQPST